MKDLNTDEYIAALVEVKESLRKMRKAFLRMRGMHSFFQDLLGHQVAADLPGKSIVLAVAQSYANNGNLPGKSEQLLKSSSFL